MFKHLLLNLFFYIQNIFYSIYNKFFIFNKVIIFDKNINKFYNYTFLFNLFYHFGFLFDINKINNHKWICYLFINEKMYTFKFNDFHINLFNNLLKYYYNNINYSNVNHIMVFKINDNIINISKYLKNTKIYYIIEFEKYINNINLINDDNIKISCLSLNKGLNYYNYNDIYNKKIDDI